MTKLFTVLLIVMILVAGCGSGGSPGSSTSTTPPAGTTSPSSNAQAGGQPQEQAAKKDLPKVTIVQSVLTLSFAPSFIADAKGYYREEGLDAKLVVVDGGAAANAALVGGSAQFGAQESASVPQLVQKGADVVAIQANVDMLTMNLVVRKDVAEKRGLSRSVPLENRLKGLKGLKFGVTGPGAATDVYTRWYLRKVGLNPEKDATIISIGGGPALAAALEQGQIDAFQLSPPTPEQVVAKGGAIALINASQGDVPELKFPYEVITTTRKYLQEHPDIVRAVARANGRANNFIRKNPDEAAKILRQYFGKVDPEILKEALRNIVPAIPADGKMTKEGWDSLIRVLQDTGMLKGAMDTTEGKYWTNEYLKDLGGKD